MSDPPFQDLFDIGHAFIDRDRDAVEFVHILGRHELVGQLDAEYAAVCLIGHRTDERGAKPEKSRAREFVDDETFHVGRGRIAGPPQLRCQLASRAIANLGALESFRAFGNLGIIGRTDIFEGLLRRSLATGRLGSIRGWFASV
nr:hypothetical protein [Bradyrhizobium zhanjiangense]